MSHGHRTATLALSTACTLMLAGTALGQNALGDGRKLDNNLNTSTGRVNPRATSVNDQIRYNNSVIYGTAPGGKSFQGYVGYRASDQFGGSVGSDTLYNFQRDAFTSGLAAQGVRGSDALRYQFALTTGQTVPGFLGAAPIGVPRSGTVATPVNSTSSALRSTSEFVTGQSYRPTLVGVKHDELGAEYVAKASPLLGVTWVKTAESPLGTNVPGMMPSALGVLPTVPPVPGIPDQTSGTNPSGVAAPNTTAPANPSNPVNPNAPAGQRPSEMMPTSPFTGLETTSRGIAGALDRPNALDTRVTGMPLESVNSVHNQMLNRFRDGFPQSQKSADDKNKEPVSFEDQMDRLHRMLDSNAPAESKKPVPGERGPDGLPILSKPKPIEPKDVPSRERPDPIEQTPKDAKGRNIDTNLESLTPDFLKAVKKVQEKKVEHFAEPAPAAGPDTSSDPVIYRNNMRDGEKLLSQAKFFDAEDAFVRAIASAPRDPMARAARLHAQIGAGLYLSAATNLRALLAGHPEMIGVRFADNLFPSAERCKIITEQLTEQEQKSDSALGREAALLLAYMGYQRGDAALTSDGLDKFAKRIATDESGDPDRALLTLVKAAWTAK